MLSVRNVCKTFHPGTVNEVRALRGVSVDVPEGAFLVILGGNGSGKSTLLNAVAGCFRPDAGEIHLGAHNVTRWPEHRRARLIGRVFQNPFTGSAPSMSIAENLALAARRGLPRRLGWAIPKRLLDELRDRVKELEMGLEDRLGNAIGSLSGGQRQALSMTMSRLCPADFLILDEHTAALDPNAADMIMEMTDRMVREGKLTAIMVTHNLRYALKYGSRLIMMHQGGIEMDVQGEEKKNLPMETLLKKFNDISIECGN